MRAAKGIKSFLACCAIAAILFWPDFACAVQAHGGAEGLVAHQLGHTILIFGIIYLLYRIYRSRFRTHGWVEFKTFLWLLISWNLLTFTGHLIQEFVPADQYLRTGGHIIGIKLEGATDFFFYLTRLDHLLLVPAFIFLFLALRKWRGQP